MQKLKLLQTKIINKEVLPHQINRWKFNSDQIVFITGCFDPLKASDVRVLAQAADLGHRLVVGVYSDLLAKQNFHKQDLFQSQEERALVLAALHHVDAVIYCNEISMDELIKIVKPDVLVNNTENSLEAIAEANTLQQFVGKAIRADDIEAQGRE